MSSTSSLGLTPGDKLAAAIARGSRCKITFSTGSIEVGDVRYYGKDPNPPGTRDLWVLSTPRSQRFFGLDELRDVHE
jgi:hypothetical protein